jgi:hypothetical protein
VPDDRKIAAECHRRAAKARRMADVASTPAERADLLAGCGKTEQGSRSDSDPFTWGFGYVHGQNEFFRSLLDEVIAITH